ncbi:MAG: hypothetical protein HY665_04070 [Chloroflexi bacterium]|nr:hypothetical protein [Chloroflexota bacterium]
MTTSTILQDITQVLQQTPDITQVLDRMAPKRQCPSCGLSLEAMDTEYDKEWVRLVRHSARNATIPSMIA